MLMFSLLTYCFVEQFSVNGFRPHPLVYKHIHLMGLCTLMRCLMISLLVWVGFFFSPSLLPGNIGLLVGGASVYRILNVLCCAVIGQICCICGIATLRTCQEESCRDSPALSSASRRQTCLSTLFLFFIFIVVTLLVCLSLTFLSLSSFMFDEPSSYLDVKQRLRAAITIRSLISPDRSATHTEGWTIQHQYHDKLCAYHDVCTHFWDIVGIMLS